MWADAAVVEPIKDFYARKRPYEIDPQLKPRIELEKTPGYPSGHAARLLILASTLAEIFGGQKESLCRLAAEIPARRVKVGMHFPSDIEAGRILGEFIYSRMREKPAFQSRLSKAERECRAAGHYGELLKRFQKHTYHPCQSRAGVADELLECLIGHFHEFFHAGQALASEFDGPAVGGLLAEGLLVQHFAALANGFQDRVHLTAFALGGDQAEHVPYIGMAFKIFPTFASLVQAMDDAPVAQGAEGHADISAADVQAYASFTLNQLWL